MYNFNYVWRTINVIFGRPYRMINPIDGWLSKWYETGKVA